MKNKLFKSNSLRVLCDPPVKCFLCREALAITKVEVGSSISYVLGSRSLFPNPGSKIITFRAKCKHCDMDFDGQAQEIAYTQINEIVLKNPMVERGSLMLGKSIEDPFFNPSRRY